MQDHLHPPRALLDRDLLPRVLEPAFFHRHEKYGCFVAAGVGEQGLTARTQEPGYQVGEGRRVLAFVEDVGGENEVEGSQTFDVRRAPVEEGRVGLEVQVGAGVVGGEVEGGFVMVRGEDRCAAGEGDDGGQADAATEFDSSRSGEVAFGEVAG